MTNERKQPMMQWFGRNKSTDIDPDAEFADALEAAKSRCEQLAGNYGTDLAELEAEREQVKARRQEADRDLNDLDRAIYVLKIATSGLKSATPSTSFQPTPLKKPPDTKPALPKVTPLEVPGDKLKKAS